MDSSLSLVRPTGMHAPALLQQQQQQQQQPLFDVDNPTNNDVLCGRGVTTNRHTGNENFRSLVNCNKVRFRIFPIFSFFSRTIYVAYRNVGSAGLSTAT